MGMKKRQKLFLIAFVSFSIFAQYLEIPDVTVYGEKEIDILPAKKSPLFFIVKPDSFVVKDIEVKIIEDRFREEYKINNFGFYTKISAGSFFDTNLVSFDERISFFAQNEYLPLFIDAGIKRDYKFYDYKTLANISLHPVENHSIFAEYSKIKADSIEEIFALDYLLSSRFYDFKIGFLTRNSNLFFLSDLNLKFKNFNISLYIFDLFLPDSNMNFSITYDIKDYFRAGLSFKKYPLPIFTYLLPVYDIFFKSEFSKSRFPFQKNIQTSYFDQFFTSDKYRVSLGCKYLKSGYTTLFMKDSVFHGLSFSIYNPFNINIYYFFDKEIFISSDFDINLMDRFLLTLMLSSRKGINLFASAEFMINNMISLFIESISLYELDSYNIRTGLKIRKVF